MNVHEPHLRERSAVHPWRMATAGFALLYGLLLALVFTTMSFSEEDTARHYYAQVANRPPAPLPPLPVVRSIELPDIVMRRDPFQPLATSTKQGPWQPEPLGTSGDTSTSELFRFVASYLDMGQPVVLGRGGTGELARFRVGDKVDGGVIERVDPSRVILNSGGRQNVVEILRVEPGRVQ